MVVLEKVFAMDQFPNVDTRKQLGEQLNVSTRQIQVWFQNRRQRERKNRNSASGRCLDMSMETIKTVSPGQSTEDLSLGEVDASEKTDAGRLPLAPMPRLTSPSDGSLSPRSEDGPTKSPLCDKEETELARPACLDEAIARKAAMMQGVSHPFMLASTMGHELQGGGGKALDVPLRSLGAASFLEGPHVGSRLAAACQSTLIGRTLQEYGGIVQVITEPRAPYSILSVSPGWQRLTGWSREEVVGKPLKCLQGPETEADAVATLMSAVDKQRPVSVRLTNYTKSGASFVHQLSCEPLRDVSGVAQCFQSTSLVLRRPGDADTAEELAVGQLPLLHRDTIPPLWPLLGRGPAHAHVAAPPTQQLPNLGVSLFDPLGLSSPAAPPHAAAPPTPGAAALSRPSSLPKVSSCGGLAGVAAGDSDEFLNWLGDSEIDREIAKGLDDDLLGIFKDDIFDGAPPAAPCPVA